MAEQASTVSAGDRRRVGEKQVHQVDSRVCCLKALIVDSITTMAEQYENAALSLHRLTSHVITEY